MIQRFIELGEGYNDIYEWITLAKTNQSRIHAVCYLITEKQQQSYASVALILKAPGDSSFMPIYICREGIPYSKETPNKRMQLIEKTMEEVHQLPHRLEIKHSSFFAESILYYQYVIGVLRLNHIIPKFE